MNTSNLRERVARAICKAEGDDPDSLDPWMESEHQHPAWEHYEDHADAAIAIVLEEAAKVCDEHAARYEADMQIGDDDGTLECVAAALRGRAAAIRALKEEKDV
jgi:hypothetical protein